LGKPPTRGLKPPIAKWGSFPKTGYSPTLRGEHRGDQKAQARNLRKNPRKKLNGGGPNRPKAYGPPRDPRGSPFKEDPTRGQKAQKVNPWVGPQGV